MSLTPEIDGLSDVDIVARTVWGEARGEGRDGWVAVAWVIKNRAAKPDWWGRNLRQVCLKADQFSCWNENDPNRQKMLEIDTYDPLYRKIRATVSDVLAGTIPDPTAGAVYYHTQAVHPAWDAKMVQTASIGAHEFYKEEKA